MEITTRQFKHCDLIAVKGRVDSATAPQMSEVFEMLQKNGKFKIVVDMTALEYMSSAGFRALLAGQRVSRRYNRGEIILASVPPRIKDSLELAGFTTLFKICDDVTTAVGSF